MAAVLLQEMGEKGLALLERMLAMNPSQRITSKDACLEVTGTLNPKARFVHSCDL